jgi:hypothetical protein
VKRKCACGTILRRDNLDDECWQCEERSRLAALLPPVEPVGPPKPKPAGNPSGICKCGCGERTPISKHTRAAQNVAAGVPVHYKRGHGSERRGRTNGNSKLNAEAVIRMRREYARGGTSFRAIAEKYGCGEQTARQAIRGVSWSHVPMEDAA